MCDTTTKAQSWNRNNQMVQNPYSSERDSGDELKWKEGKQIGKKDNKIRSSDL